MGKIVEVEALIKVEVTEEQYEELKSIKGERATAFLSFGIDREDYNMDVYMVSLEDED